MKLELHERDGVRILECVAPLVGPNAANDLIGESLGQGADCILLEARHLPAAFFELRSGFAGEFVQKLVNYRTKVAAVFPVEAEYGERFVEFLRELKRGHAFRAFENRAEAEAWLVARE